MGVFGDWAERYWEHGYNVLPCDETRATTIGRSFGTWENLNWDTRRQTQDEIDKLLEVHSHDEGIAIISGPASGCSIIDLDTDDKIIQQKLPRLPWHCGMIRRGSKGAGMFIRYVAPEQIGLSPDTKKESIDGIIELFYSKQYLVVPPSKSNKIKTGDGRYHWINETGIVDSSELPEFNDGLEQLHNWIKDRKNGVPLRGSDRARPIGEKLGRNNLLVELAGSLSKKVVLEGYPLTEAIADLIHEDNLANGSHPDGPWFCDENEKHKSTTPHGRAKSMLDRFIRADEQKYTVNEELDLRLVQELLGKKDSLERSYDPGKWADLMPSSGFIHDFHQAVKEVKDTNNYALSMGAAIATANTVAANKVAIGLTRSNSVIINLASSGAGKDAPFQMAQNVLMSFVREGAKPLVGRRFKSANVYEKSFERIRERLDPIDEFNILMKATGSSKHALGGFHQIVCAMFSRSSDMHVGSFAMDKSREVGVIHNPCNVILGAGVLEDFAYALPQDAFSSGFIGRSLIFVQPQVKVKDEDKDHIPYGFSFEDDQDASEMIKLMEKQKIIDMCAHWLKPLYDEPYLNKSGLPYGIDTPVHPNVIDVNREVILALGQIDRKARKHEFLLRDSGEPDGIKLAPSFNRKVELINKIIIALCVSQRRMTATMEDVERAEAIWELSLEGLSEWVIGAEVQGDYMKQLTDAMLRCYEARLKGHGMFRPEGDKPNEFNIRMLKVQGSVKRIISSNSWHWDAWLKKMKEMGAVTEYKKGARGRSYYIAFHPDEIR